MNFIADIIDSVRYTSSTHTRKEHVANFLIFARSDSTGKLLYHYLGPG